MSAPSRPPSAAPLPDPTRVRKNDMSDCDAGDVGAVVVRKAVARVSGRRKASIWRLRGKGMVFLILAVERLLGFDEHGDWNGNSGS